MIYLLKEGSKAYQYVKGVIDAENKEKEAYFKRVEEAVGFEVGEYIGYQPNGCLLRKYEITALLIDKEKWEKMDKKVWRMEGLVESYIQIEPNRRTKQGKTIDEVFKSYHSIASFSSIHKDLNIPRPNESRFFPPQLLFDGIHYFVFIDDSIRADKFNDGLEEITIGRYEDMVNEANKK